MLSNGVAHLANGVFLGVTRDDADHGYLFADQSSLSHAPVALLNLSRRTFFDVSVDGRPQNGASAATCCSASVDDCSRGQCSAQSLYASCGGHFALALSPFARRHTILHVDDGAVNEFITERPILCCCWHPTTDHVLFLLESDGTILALDVSLVAHHVAPKVLDCISAVDIFQALARRRATGTTAGRKQSRQDQQAAAIEADEVTKRLVFVAIAAVAETPGLPTMLLLLTSRGDLISLKVGRDFHPECDATTAAALNERHHLQALGADNGLLLLAGYHNGGDKQQRQPLKQLLSGTAVFSTVMHRPDDDGSGGSDDDNLLETPPFCVHHVLQGHSDIVRHADAAHSITLTAHMVDPHAGLHCVSILSASGNVRGYYLYERELLSIDLHRTRCDVVITLTMAPLKVPMTTVHGNNKPLNPHSSTAAPTGAGHTAHLESLRPLLQNNLLVSNGNIIAAKLNGSEHLFLIAFPVWCPIDGDGNRQEWMYLEPARDGCDRIPSPGRDACDIPHAIATRIPLDVKGYSVAVGDGGSMLLFPQIVGCTGPDIPEVATEAAAQEKPHALPIVRLQTVELLDAALRASMESAQMLGLSPPPNGAAVDPSLTRLATTIDRIARLHRDTLCNTGTSEDHRKATEDVGEALEAMRSQLHTCEATTTARQERMTERVAGLRARMAATTARATRMRDVLLDATYSRDGVDAIRRVNLTLGELKKSLNELQVCLTAAEARVHHQTCEVID